MLMSRSKYILFAVFALLAAGAFAQKAERDYIRKGNRFFNDSVFVDAEVNYRKALEANPKSTVSMYNLGNTLSQQQKFKEAMEQYVAAGKIEKDKMKLAHIYHNMGVLFHQQQQQPPKPEKKENEMSKENAEQLLNSVMQDEKETQDKVKKQQQVIQGGRLEKDW